MHALRPIPQLIDLSTIPTHHILRLPSATQPRQLHYQSPDHLIHIPQNPQPLAQCRARISHSYPWSGLRIRLSSREVRDVSRRLVEGVCHLLALAVWRGFLARSLGHSWLFHHVRYYRSREKAHPAKCCVCCLPSGVGLLVSRMGPTGRPEDLRRIRGEGCSRSGRENRCGESAAAGRGRERWLSGSRGGLGRCLGVC